MSAMAPVNPATHNIPSDDELDAILNGADADEDIFDTSNIRPQLEPQTQRRQGARNDNLGIDEEITIEKKRQPIPKLNEDRILSAAGIPRLRRISKERLRFKGKGHEYGDIARMLNMYQLWLDDLYPRAKFADGLAMIEALGHKKRIQVMRKEWIDEGKPKHKSDTESEDEDPRPVETIEKSTDGMEGVQSGTLDEETAPEHQVEESAPQGAKPAEVRDDYDEPDEDELDALLGESAAPDTAISQAVPKPNTAPAEDDPFADEMEAMAEMDGMW